ncbi:MAG: hypothetical protein F6K17_21360 [Okeania sp. SIO3C4]|nr:hypothetical protein [Okeania sp. SIO3B3]NER04961.1 hypothetical protein [Okeania sp. SIO3C4]
MSHILEFKLFKIIPFLKNFSIRRKKEEGRKKKEEGRRKKIWHCLSFKLLICQIQ